ncbi:uncharacterized protein GGS22DRAFT_196697 [Annulohypoxylon maeteangense]|uniref:uncharacterized protein n=1 Tax=Annulohypoxylon maeteangense TaxID=1927788 RepID=UPI00200869AA|nr:uncharacterized protein GGS22DRAFT_196697 [Annulohypoxylon maeteangense]KAI0888912.1 hypothetical protein GGS22DRAFT_196697 [Annulohypoxylon maeteangense]
MPQWDKSRDYYADLDISSSASTEEVKKQFKKLALKYHPDRNPGREAEVNPKFQTIQSAHEILSDDRLRRQYDDARRSHVSRYPKASGVRGNPWQDIGKQYQPPPTRHQTQSSSHFGRPPTSGADRYAPFTNSMPQKGKSTPRDDPQSRKSYADAWENMRSSSTRRAPPATPGRAPTSAARDANTPKPEYAPPKSAYQQQKAQASFGNSSRRAGFTPRSPGLADEPPVTNKNYFTTRTHSTLFNEVDPDVPQPSARPSAPTASTASTASTSTDQFAQFKGKVWDDRQSTPYHTPGGEKTSLFDDGLGIGRTSSTRSPRRPDMPGSFPQYRPRSSSTPKSATNDAAFDESMKNFTGHAGSKHTGTATTREMPNGSSTPQPVPSDRYKPNVGQSNGVPPSPFGSYPATPTPVNGSKCMLFHSMTGMLHIKLHANMMSLVGGNSAQPSNGPSVYALSHIYSPPPSCPKLQSSNNTTSKRFHLSAVQVEDRGCKLRYPSSEDESAHPSLLSFEEIQKHHVARLINGRAMSNKRTSSTSSKSSSGNSQDPIAEKKLKIGADPAYSSFNFSAASDEAFKGTGKERLSKPSTDSINTKFSEDWDELPEELKFSAGTASTNGPQTPTKGRPQSRSRSRRQTPKTRPAEPERMPSMPEGLGNAAGTGFSAGEWSDKIGSQHFVPQSSRSVSSSPTRRTNLKKGKPVKMTAGTAGLVDEDESDGYHDAQSTSSGSAQANADTATAMDIDSPPPQKVDETPKAPQTNGARKIPVEPHREEWRAGDVNGVRTKSASPVRDGIPAKRPYAQTTAPQAAPIPVSKPFAAQHGGSEDTDEFCTTFADFKKVEPFVNPSATGLKDFSDLKSTLPFESKPSEQIPLEREQPSKWSPLDFPSPPVAPRLPPTVVVPGIQPNKALFRKYSQEFYQYLDKWEIFSSRVMAHFSTRQDLYRQRRQHLGLAWLETPSGARDYLLELEQDQAVRVQWSSACADHEAKIREFMTFRDQVK